MKHRCIGGIAGFSLIAGLFALTAPAHAASFDCTKLASNVEKMICGDSSLSDLDSKLHDIYKAALAAADHSSEALRKEQRNWAQYARALCEDAACLKQTYAARIAVLARNEKYIINKTSCQKPDGASECVSTIMVRDPNWRILSFDQTLADQKKPGKLIGCTMLVELPGMSTDSNSTYGGYCVLAEAGKRTQVEICNDDMIGKFAMAPIDPAKESEQGLLNFANACPGG